MRMLRNLILTAGMSAVLAACAAGPGAGPAPARPTAEVGLDGTLRLARAALAGGDVDSGIRLLRQAADAFPGSLEVQWALADAYYGIGAFPEAAMAYERLQTVDPRSPKGPLGVGRVALSRGDVPTALDAFTEALRREPDDGRARNGLAVAYDYGGRHAEAQAIYRDLLAHNPADRSVANNLALSQALAGDAEESINRLSDLANGPALLPHARYNLALVYGMQGDEAAARDILRRDLDQHAVAENLAFYQAVQVAVLPEAPTP